jgi:hypothetical protein
VLCLLPLLLLVSSVGDAWGRARWQTPGAYRFRVTHLAPYTLDDAGTESGQRVVGRHRLRIDPTIEMGVMELHLQIDVLTGQIFGDQAPVGARFVPRRAPDPYRNTDGWTTVEPRMGWLRWSGHWGSVAFGQMGANWGLGVVDTDGRDRDEGDWVKRLGDRWGGDLVERLEVTISPFAQYSVGPLADVAFSLGGDYVWQDDQSNLLDGDTAYRVFASVVHPGEALWLGVYGVHRWQADEDGDDASVSTLDLHARWSIPLYMIAADMKLETEVVLQHGQSSRVRPVSSPKGVDVLALGWVARGDIAWRCPRIALGVEGGYASGDADPADGDDQTFTFDPDHQVGLLLFSDVLRLVTLRSAERLADAERVGRAPVGADLVPTQGAVRNALYLFPVAAWRPGRWRLQVAGLLAWAAEPFLDPTETFEAGGTARNHHGRIASHFYGGELAALVEYALKVPKVGAMALGLEGGVFFTGKALDGALAESTVSKVLARVDLRW